MGKKDTVVVDADFADIMPQYLEIRHKELREIQEALEKGDAEQVGFLGHRLSGSGGSYGLDELTRLGKLLEEAAKAGDMDEAANLIESLAGYLSNLEIAYDGE